MFNDQGNELDNSKLTKLDSVTVKRNPSSDNELANKEYIDDSLDGGKILKLNKTLLQVYLKVSVGKDVCNLTKYKKIQIMDTTLIKAGKTGANLLQKWKIKCNDRNNNGNIHLLVRSTRTISPTSHAGATMRPPIGDSLI